MPNHSYFTDTCNVSRPTSSNQPYGSQRAYASLLTGQPCRYRTSSETVFSAITAEQVVVTNHKMHFPYGADIQQGDRVTSISLDNGNETVTENFEVTGDIERRGRMTRIKSVRLSKVS